MASKLGIWNMALSHLGISKEVATVNESSQEARALDRFYDETLKEVLSDFPWPFATKFEVLGLVEEDPNIEWQFSYRYPTDCLHVRKILSGNRNDNRQSRVPYRIAIDSSGKLIFTDMQDAELEYTCLIDNPEHFPSDFTLMLSYRLASHVAPRVTGQDEYKMGDKAMQKYMMELSKAKARSINEEQSEEVPDSEFISGRN
jgi:hypothetical protein